MHNVMVTITTSSPHTYSTDGEGFLEVEQQSDASLRERAMSRWQSLVVIQKKIKIEYTFLVNVLKSFTVFEII